MKDPRNGVMWSRVILSDTYLEPIRGGPAGAVVAAINELHKTFDPCTDLLTRVYRHGTLEGTVIEMRLGS